MRICFYCYKLIVSKYLCNLAMMEFLTPSSPISPSIWEIAHSTGISQLHLRLGLTAEWFPSKEDTYWEEAAPLVSPEIFFLRSYIDPSPRWHVLHTWLLLRFQSLRHSDRGTFMVVGQPPALRLQGDHQPEKFDDLAIHFY